jgi:hypothetical protein
MSYQKKYLKYKSKYLNLVYHDQIGCGRNNNMSCPICTEPFPNPPAGVDQLTFMHLNTDEFRETTCCNTVFHALCINEWIYRNNTCPNCRHEPIDFVDIHPIITINYVSPLSRSEYPTVVANRFAGPTNMRKNVIQKFKDFVANKPERERREAEERERREAERRERRERFGILEINKTFEPRQPRQPREQNIDSPNFSYNIRN